jgi:hypothetical protein
VPIVLENEQKREKKYHLIWEHGLMDKYY